MQIGMTFEAIGAIVFVLRQACMETRHPDDHPNFHIIALVYQYRKLRGDCPYLTIESPSRLTCETESQCANKPELGA